MKKSRAAVGGKSTNRPNNFRKLMPSLDKLAQKEDSVKVTLSLTKASVEYFKNAAAELMA